MAKGEFKFEIKEIVSCIKESPKHNWGKFIAKISYNDKPANYDIRNINLEANRIGSGIVLEPEEIDAVVDTFVELGFGSTDKLEAEVEKRKSRYNIGDFDSDSATETELLN